MKIIPYEQAQLNAFASAKEPAARNRKGQRRSGRMDTCCSTATASPSSAKVAAAIRNVSFTPVMWRKYCNQHKHGHKSAPSPMKILFSRDGPRHPANARYF